MGNRRSKHLLTIKIVLAVIGFSILMINGKMYSYYSSDLDTLTYRLPFMILGILLMLPILIYMIRKR
jgi:hypothetical protein